MVVGTICGQTTAGSRWGRIFHISSHWLLSKVAFTMCESYDYEEKVKTSCEMRLRPQVKFRLPVPSDDKMCTEKSHSVTKDWETLEEPVGLPYNAWWVSDIGHCYREGKANPSFAWDTFLPGKEQNFGVKDLKIFTYHRSAHPCSVLTKF